MIKKFKNQYCIHCLNYFEELTEDHIFPKSWYPYSTPQNIEKWVAPACNKCNEKLGKIEEAVYKKIAPAMSKNDIASLSISEKAMRLYNPACAKNHKDKQHRFANLKKIKSDIILAESDNLPTNLIRNFGCIANPSRKVPMVYISFDLLNPLFEKIIRGLEFKLRNRLINNDEKIEFIHILESIDVSMELRQLNAIFTKDGLLTGCGPGFVVQTVGYDSYSFLYHVIIWGKLEIWATIKPIIQK